ncbi:DoxX family protein [Gelidibacter salicanalis]|uniref:DoxX family protein n=1 Tax=Gelidibacter salicanalis TaxID=291193 RepID=A0A934NDP9_9FLAO|nr:DoxX family protein [Gelidibacter salicanalis]MBJ7881925.1 DoxX family protein [Gelidibacter salicanalis]
MAKRNPTAGRTGKIVYWVATIWLALGMVSTGIVQLIQMNEEVENFTNLGYPIYLMTLLGIWKILGVIVVLVPKFPLLKEWAYAGFFFVMSGAIISHLAVGNTIDNILPPLLLLVLTILSWYSRPIDRKLIFNKARL